MCSPIWTLWGIARRWRAMLSSFAAICLLAFGVGAHAATASDLISPDLLDPAKREAILKSLRQNAKPVIYPTGLPALLEQLDKARKSGQAAVNDLQTRTLRYAGGAGGLLGTSVHTEQPRVYLVLAGPGWGSTSTDSKGRLIASNDKEGVLPLAQDFFRDLGTSGELWSGTLTQYCGGADVLFGMGSCPKTANHIPYPKAGQVLAGVWFAPTLIKSNATQDEIASAAVKAAQHFGNTTPQSNDGAQYFILTAPGETPYLMVDIPGMFSATRFRDPDSIACAVHAHSTWFIGKALPVTFATIPYQPDHPGCASDQPGFNLRKKDWALHVIAHEYSEAMTDANLFGWINMTALTDFPNINIADTEISDMCFREAQGGERVKMANGSYFLPRNWSNDTQSCELTHPVVKGACGDDYTGLAGTCWQKCKPGFTDMGTTCVSVETQTRSTYSRGAGVLPTASCAAGKQMSNGLCYSACNSGYSGVGPLCMGSCPAGTDYEVAGTCTRRPHGWGDWGWVKTKPSYTRSGSLPTQLQCSAGTEMSVGMCYKPCTSGYTGVSAVCTANSCPAGFTDMKLFCSRSTSYTKKSFVP